MEQKEFCNRFVARTTKVAGMTLADGTSIEEYAKSTAQPCWENEDQRAEGPEECADADISYWGE